MDQTEYREERTLSRHDMQEDIIKALTALDYQKTKKIYMLMSGMGAIKWDRECKAQNCANVSAGKDFCSKMSESMGGQEYRKYIKQMTDRISDRKALQKIYEFVHSKFIYCAER